MRAGAAIVLAAAWFGALLAPASAAGSEPRGFANLGATVRSPLASTATLSGEELELLIEVTSKDLRAATGELNAAERTLAAAEEEAERLRVEEAALAQETLRTAIEGYQYSEIPQQIWTADDVNESIRASALAAAAASADTEGFEAYRALRKDLEIIEAEVVTRRDLVAALQAEVDRLEAELIAELVRFGELEELRIQELAAGVTIQATNRAQARGRKQGFYLDTCPVDGTHSFIDSWGFARSGGRRHQGVDILAAIGTPVVAPVSGRVEHSSNSIGGRSFRLFGDDGNYFYGTHLSAYGASGQVRAGEVIGYVGDDGNAAGIPHLHFEIHPGGRGNPINPYIDSAAVCAGAN